MLFLASVVFSIGSVNAAHQEISTSFEPSRFVIGVISSNPKKAVKRTAPLARYLAKHLSEHGITSSQVVVARDTRQMSRWLKQGRVDMVSESVFPATALVQRANAEIIAKRWKSGVSQYATVFFAKKSSDISSFDGLLGKTVVFEDRESSSAFYIPAAILIEQGYPLYELASPREKPPQGQVGYLFADELTKAGGEINMYSWVYNDIVAAAAFSNVDWNSEIPSAMKEKMNIFYQSQFVPRSLELVRPGMDPKLKTHLQTLLYAMHLNDEGREVLQKYKKTKKFEAIDASTSKGIEWVKQLKPTVDELLVL